MNNIYVFIIFVVTFFLYFHIIKQYETSEDLEIYEMDYLDNENLQETCEIKQPVLFYRGLQELPDISTYKQLLNIKSVNDINPIELPCEAVMELLHSQYSEEKRQKRNENEQPREQKEEKEETNVYYFSENNSNFIEETVLYKIFKNLDYELKPKITTMSTNYDILLGGKDSYTPLRYHKNSRKFIYVVEGESVRIKMAPWKFTKYLHEIKDFENFEYRSEINVWNNTNNVFENDLMKVLRLFTYPSR